MKCFNHDTADAVAICKSCNKAICHTCAVDVGSGIACRNSCETEVRSLNELIQRNKSASARTGYAYQRNAIVFLLLGAILAYFSIGAYRTGNSAILLITGGSAAVFFLAAFFNYSAARKFTSGGL